MFAFCICHVLALLAVLSAAFEDERTLRRENGPRLLRDAVFAEFKDEGYQNHTVLQLDEDTGEIYAGGEDFLFKLDVEKFATVTEKYNLSCSEEEQGLAGNTVTIIEKLHDRLFVCGTNGIKPRCWTIFLPQNNLSYQVVETQDVAGISPFTYTQNCLSLTVEGDVYTAAPLDKDGSFLQFRRRAESRSDVWMDENWLSDPTFVSASWVQWKEDPDNDKIYMFFREKNSDNNPEAEPWISRVARVCKVDEGGSKQFLQNTWTSFLKARLVCGYREESLYFNRLQDVHVMHADDWHLTRIYALFSSSWNSSAVCIYTVKTIEGLFESSSFKGYDKEIPQPRPGTCVKNRQDLSMSTLNMLKDYPEMSQWVYPLHSSAPFYVSNYHYRKIAVDTVQAADQHLYNVLLLATDSGRIHKVLESGSEPFIILQTEPLSNSSVHSMKLDSKRKKLVVGFSDKIVVLNLQNCQDYNTSCEDCVLARDPYCSWTASGCAPTELRGVNGSVKSGAVQDFPGGQLSACSSTAGNRTKRDTDLSQTEQHVVPLGSPLYMSCPIDSYHATYRWEHGPGSGPCLPVNSECLLLIPALAEEHYGLHRCVSTEHNHTKVVKTYHLRKPTNLLPASHDRRHIIRFQLHGAAAEAPRVPWTLLGLVLALCSLKHL
ncbi:semaphorin-7A-like isoform 1-T1 [Synchiropus picturatus]